MSNKYGIIIPFVDGDQEAPKFFLSGYLRKLNALQYRNAIQNICYILIIDNQNKRSDFIEYSRSKITIKAITDFSKENDIPYGDLSKNIYTSIKKDKSLEVENNVDILFHLINKVSLQKKFLQNLEEIEESHKVNQWVILEGHPGFGSLTFPRKSLRNGSSDTYPKWIYNIEGRMFYVFVSNIRTYKFNKEASKGKHSHLDLANFLKT